MTEATLTKSKGVRYTDSEMLEGIPAVAKDGCGTEPAMIRKKRHFKELLEGER